MVSYEPPFGFIQISVDTRGEVTVQTKDLRRLVTPIGTFGLDFAQDLVPAANEFILVIRDQRRPEGQQDRAFRVKTNSNVVVDAEGRTRVHLTNQQLLLDVTGGRHYSILVNGKPSDFARVEPRPRKRRAPAEPLPSSVADSMGSTNRVPDSQAAHVPVAVVETVIVNAPIPQPTSPPEALPDLLAAGSQVVAALDKELKSGAGAKGDKITAHVVDDIRAPSGRLIMPRGSRVHLRVLAFPHPSDEGDADGIALKVVRVSIRGKEYSLSGEVAPPTLQISEKRISGSDAPKVAVGAALGAGIGALLKGRSGAVRGGAIGAGAGAVASATTVERRARLQSGTPLYITLTEAFAPPHK